MISGCLGMAGLQKKSELKVGIDLSEIYPDWQKTDRCTKCHMAWTWEYGYYRGWDRHGFISDYSEVAPTGYKDPYGLDVPFNNFVDYYYTNWWSGEVIRDRKTKDPEMHLDGYGRINDGTVKPSDFKGEVIVVDTTGFADAVTIQEAIDKASPGATVFVRPGTYKENLRMKENIRLWGENAYTTIIDSQNKASAIVAANGCDISGFTITGTGFDYSEDRFRAAVHTVDCDSTLVIRGNLFFSNAVFGIIVESTRSDGYSINSEDRFVAPENALDTIEYSGYSNPLIIGNMFYNIGERAVYCIHSSPEIANNIFMGNLKTLGMTQLSKPFIHHNIFYRNSVSININRSMPIVSHNIMINNYWGQRIMEGSFPVIHDNVTWNSPYYNEFGEDGSRIPYKPIPGTGEQEIDPMFVDMDAGDFRYGDGSPLVGTNTNVKGYGVIVGRGIQVPPTVACQYSWAEELLHRTDQTNAIVDTIARQNARIKSIDCSYTVEYKSFMTAEYDSSGNQVSVDVKRTPVSGTTYEAQLWSMMDGKRRKVYCCDLFSGAKAETDSGTVVYDGREIRALSGRFKIDRPVMEYAEIVGERPHRENIGGLYFDYDQYLNGSIGPGGTFYYGYLRILGGEQLEETEEVDGHQCIVVRYPHLGRDQVYKFYLDSELDYRPRRLEQYFERNLYRRIDHYSYISQGGTYIPVSAQITDYAVKEPNLGKVIGITEMRVKPGTLKVNGTSLDIATILPEQIDFIEVAKNGTWTPPPKTSRRTRAEAKE